MIDINDFDAIRIGLASSEADPRLVFGRGHEAGDDQLPHAQARARRPVLRAHLRADARLGVLLRQVQARPLQGHHLRALRRRGDAAEGAPRAHGSHRPRRAGLAHLVLQGRAEPHRLPARHRAARAREGALLRRLDRHGGRQREARRRPERARGPGQGRGRAASTSTATRRSPRSRTGSPAAATTSRRARSGTSTRTTTSGAAASRTGPRSRRCRRSRTRASSSAGSSSSSSRRSRPRTRRRSASSSATPRSATTAGSTPRELEQVAVGGRADPGRDRAAREGAREGDRREEGRDHEAHPPHRRRAARRATSCTRTTSRSSRAST